jgi:beta-lactamase regulating signal transducer with metallopeptidase domain
LWSVLSFVSASRGTAGIFPVLAPLRSLIAAWLPYGSSLYLLVLAGLLVRYCYHYFYSNKLTREGLSPIGPGFRVFVAETSRRMGIRPVVNVWLSKLIDVPVTLGFLKPVILLPFAMAGHLTTEQVEAILVHELAHIRRHDFLLNLGVTLLEGLFFFNPFTRWFIADLKKEREYCCDDLVLQFRYDPQTYVSALLSVARQASQGQKARLVVAATGSGSNQLLLQRAKRILQQQRTGERPGARPFALLLLTVLITLINLSKPAHSLSEPAHSSSEPTRSLQEAVIAADQEKQVKLASVSPVSPASPASPSEVQVTPLLSNQTASLLPGAPSLPRANRAIHSHHLAHPAKPERAASEQADETTLPLITAVADADLVNREELVNRKEFVAIIRKDNREYSISKSRPATRTPAKEDGQPFIPKSSFSYLSIEEDTLRPEEKLARVQFQAQQDIARSMQKLQMDLMAQLELVKARQKQLQDYNLPEDVEGLREQQTLIEEQLRLQRSYMQKLDELQKRLKKAQRHFTIVYI